MFTSVTRALSGPISILMTGMYHLGSIQSVLCTRGPLLLRSHLVSSGPYWSQTHVGKKKKKEENFHFILSSASQGLQHWTNILSFLFAENDESRLRGGDLNQTTALTGTEDFGLKLQWGKVMQYLFFRALLNESNQRPATYSLNIEYLASMRTKVVLF